MPFVLNVTVPSFCIFALLYGSARKLGGGGGLKGSQERLSVCVRVYQNVQL
jgi:hypothetical protein